MSIVYDFLIMALEFFKTGLFAIGGGLATIPFLREMAVKYPWFEVSELTDMIAVSESTPGPIGVNMATYAGFNMGVDSMEGFAGVLIGILGGICATLALICPSIIIILIVAKFLEKFKKNKIVDGAFYGIRPCSAALVASAMLDVLLLSVFTGSRTIDIFGLSVGIPETVNVLGIVFFVLLIPFIAKFKKVHPIVFIAIGAVVGIVFKM
ncbi:MAG: chromate transporter [Ruminococcaceae bacterium]|nr:chromate transporter [Oscillospiraceae bacterium]